MNHKKRGEGKSGQISIFLILALIVLTSGTLWYVFVQDHNPFILSVPEEVAPVHSFIVSCMQDAANEALLRIGSTGGYATIPQDVLVNPMASLQFGPSDDLRMPYWWYDGKSRVPTLDFMRAELERDSLRLAEDCIDNFSAFESQYRIERHGQARVVVDANDEGTLFTLAYPITISTFNNQSSYDDDAFIYESKARLKKTHEIAMLMMERENKDAFIEYKALDLMALDPKNIPMTEVEMSCSRKEWRTLAVRERIKELLSANLAFIKFKGLEFGVEQYVPNPFGEETFEGSYFNTHYIWDLGIAEELEGFRASVDFDSRDRFIFNARPSDNGIMKSNVQQGTKELNFFCMQVAHFTYDLQFPVTITISDMNDAQNPFLFSFAFLANIISNQPSRTTTSFLSIDRQDLISSSEFCAKEDVMATLYTVDNSTRMDISDVNLTFSCGRYTCDIGSSGDVVSADSSGLQTPLPYCTNGIISAHKQGYLPSSQFIQTTEDTLAILPLQPITTIPFTIVAHPLHAPHESELLSSTDSALITLTPIGEGIAQTLFFPTDQNPPFTSLVGKDQHYQVSMRVIRNDLIIGGYEGEWRLNAIYGAEDIRVTFHSIIDDSVTEDGQYALLENLPEHSLLTIPAEVSSS